MKKLILVLLLLTTTFLVKAQFGSANIFPSYLYPLSFESGDFDNDGDLDAISFVTGSSSTDSLRLLFHENLGVGKFKISSEVFEKYFDNQWGFGVSLAIGDVDNDGDIDIVTNSLTSNDIVWFKNIGNNNFDSTENLITNINTVKKSPLFFIDFDNDGDNDILYCNSNTLNWIKNNGNGYFSNVTTIFSASYDFYSIFPSDMDNDGDIDILSCSYNNSKVAYRENIGGGVFNPEVVISFNTNPIYVTSGDFDNDGNKDILISYWDGRIEWHKNLGGSFGGATLISDEISAIAKVGDINNDSFLDIIVYDGKYSNQCEIFWFQNLGNSTFSKNSIIDNLYQVSDIYVADFDNDGNQDILSNGQGRSIAWYKNLGGNFEFPYKTVIGSNDGVKSVYSCDLNQDGKNDIIAGNSGLNTIVWYENLGNNNFSTQNLVSFNTPYLTNVIAFDIDGDLDNDIISNSGVKIVWFENNNGSFDTTQNIIAPSTSGIYYLHHTDLNDDGKLDIIAAQGTAPHIIWYKNLGGGLFDLAQTITENASTSMSIYTADLDGDLDLDILSASITGSKIAWYENNGGIIDTTQNIISSTANGAYSVFSIDLDNDGDNDVLSASKNDNKIAWYENLGNATFNTEQIISTNANRAFSVFAIDLDNDGDNDVISLSNNDDKIAWYENLGFGIFSNEHILTSSADGAFSMFAANLSNNGSPDILYAAFNGDEIGWFENLFDSKYILKGKVFYDANQNAILDSNEFGLSFIQTQLLPSSLASFTSNTGNYFFATDTGTYTVNFIPNSLWDLTTDSSSYTKTLTSSNPIADSLDFGFYPNTILTTIQPELTGAFPRCNDTINYWINIRNEGTTTPNGIVHLQLDDSVSYVSSINPLDSVIGQNIYWHFDSLFFFSEEMINLQVQMPSSTSMGNTLISILSVYELDGSNNIVYTNTDTLNQVLVCAYDPNDKTVLPKGIGPQGFVANNQPMEYLIRFQNTGNDTALTVMVRDQLDDNLDWGSLKPLASSHPMQVWIEQDGEAVFKFNNIMLPDSNVDFIGSQGFVKFSINQKPNLSPGTPIFNTGHIYFDNNPAVITNTVLNTIEDTISFPVSVQEINFTETNEIIVFPNPFTEHITVYYKAKINTTYHVSLYDMSGKELLKRENITNNKTELDVSHLKNGIYILVGTDHVGKKLFSQRIVAQ